MDRTKLFEDSPNRYKVWNFFISQSSLLKLFMKYFIARHQGKHTKLMLHPLDNSCKSRLNYIYNLFDFFCFCKYLGFQKKKKIIQIRIDQINNEYCCQNFGKAFPRKKCKT